MQNIILASNSPRRRELLLQLGWEFSVRPARGEEVIHSQKPQEIVRELSWQKAMEIAEEAPEGSIVIGADTIVWQQDRVLGKPKDAESACEMLRALQGQEHQVYTGVTVLVRTGEDYEYIRFEEKTDVQLYPMTATQIREYVATGEPMDKAGAYAIQGIAAKYVRGIRGEYSNVVGLPIARLYQEMHGRGMV